MADKEIQDAVIRNARRDLENMPDASQLHPPAEFESIGEAARAAGKGFLKAVGEAVDRLVPQGRDELANALFNGSAYWPGEQPPTIAPEESHGVHGAPAPVEPMELPDKVLTTSPTKGDMVIEGYNPQPRPEPPRDKSRSR